MISGIERAGRAYSFRGDGFEKTSEMAEYASLYIDPAGGGRSGGMADPGRDDLL